MIREYIQLQFNFSFYIDVLLLRLIQILVEVGAGFVGLQECVYTYYLMQVQEEYNLDSPLYDSASFIPANYNHINLELTSDQFPDDPPQHFIAPFEDHSTPIIKIIESILLKAGLSGKFPIQRLRLTLKCGFRLPQDMTLAELRTELCRESASGVTVCGQADFLGIDNQAATTLYIHNEVDFNHGQINKWFLLLNNQEPFFLTLGKQIQFKDLQAAVCGSLNQFYHNGVAAEHLRFFTIEKSKEEIEFGWRKLRELQAKEVSECILVAEHEMVGVEVLKENVQWPASEVASEEYLIFHLNNNHQVKLKFALIAKYRIGQLLRHLQLQHTSSIGPNSLGIKIVDEIFPPNRLIKEAEKYFKTGDGKFAKNVECRLVSEREMFYTSISNLKGEFTLEKEMVTIAKEKMFEECRDLAQRRIEKLNESNIYDFTSAEEISPITYYTSSVDIIDKETKTSTVLYKSLNNYLRSTTFGLQDDYHKEWRYQFSGTLIKSLKKIQPYNEKNKETGKVTVYRGIGNHQLNGEVGELYVAKEFLSTSVNRQKAEKFSKKAPIGTFVQIECFSGRSISEFSIYQTEKEVLFMPYTYFRIVQKDTSGPMYRMKLQELPAHKYRSNPATEILWVDDKLREGEKVIGSLNCPMHTTFLHQLRSNDELRHWIMNNQHIVKNEAVRIAVITNMRRRENDEDVIDAGAHTVKLVRQLLKPSRFELIFYIYHVEGTCAQLQLNGIKPEEVKIFNKRVQLREFIAACCAPNEQQEEKEEEVVAQTTQTALSAFYQSGSGFGSRSKVEETSSQ